MGDTAQDAAEEDKDFSTQAIRAELRAHGYVASIWHVDDLKGLRPDLTDEQAMQALEAVERNHDADIGINWEVLRVNADILYPEPDEPDDDATEPAADHSPDMG